MATLTRSAFLLLLAAVAAQPAPPPFPPRTVTADLPAGTVGGAVAVLSRKTGLKVEAADPGAKCPPLRLAGDPFWAALERVAAATNTRVTASNGGGIGLAPRDGPPEASSVAGAFRVVAREVTARANLAAGRTTYDLDLLAHWEPRFPVYFVNSVPTVTRAADDAGRPLTCTPVRSLGTATGFTHTLPVRLNGLTRQSKSVAVLAGSFDVVAAEAMLPFTFRDLSAKGAKGELPAGAPQGRGPVTATLREFRADGAEWEAEIAVEYPKGGPALESFQVDPWFARNTARLVSPAGKAFAPDGFDLDADARPMVARYRFKANPAGKGWALVYEASAPLVEFAVPFELKGIPLP